jgi:hypothetical protein
MLRFCLEIRHQTSRVGRIVSPECTTYTATKKCGFEQVASKRTLLPKMPSPDAVMLCLNLALNDIGLEIGHFRASQDRGQSRMRSYELSDGHDICQICRGYLSNNCRLELSAKQVLWTQGENWSRLRISILSLTGPGSATADLCGKGRVIGVDSQYPNLCWWNSHLIGQIRSHSRVIYSIYIIVHSEL